MLEQNKAVICYYNIRSEFMKRWCCLLLVILLLLLSLPANLYAGLGHQRLYGSDRAATALAVCDEGWQDGVKTVILAPSNQSNIIDALAVSSLAGQLDVPILITDKNTLDQRVKTKLLTMQVGLVYVVGAISDNIAEELRKMQNVNVVAVKGKDRYETNKKINGLLINPAGSVIVGYNSLADALSISSYAAANRYAIILADPQGNVPAAQKIYGSTPIIIGNTTEVKPQSAELRITGADAFARNAKIVETLNYSFSKVYIANGYDNHLVDALVVSPLAGRYKAPILLSNNASLASAGRVNASVNSDTIVTALGGPTVIYDSISNLIQYASPDLRVDSVTALSLNLLRIKFSEPLEKASAENRANYIIGEGDLTIGPFAGSIPMLQEDKQTVLIQLYAPAQQGRSIEIQIKKGKIYSEYKERTAIDYTNTVTLSDSTNPKIEQITTSPELNLITVTFSEPVRTPAKSDCEKWTVDFQTFRDLKLSEVEPVNETSGFAIKFKLHFENTRIGQGYHKFLIRTGSVGGQLSDAASNTFIEQELETVLAVE